MTRSFAIECACGDRGVTTNSSPDVAELHDPMPVILEPADWPVLLGEAPGDPASPLHPSPAGTLRVWPVDRRVNSPRNNGPELLAAMELAGQATP